MFSLFNKIKMNFKRIENDIILKRLLKISLHNNIIQHAFESQGFYFIVIYK
jgi:hypothetical protein